MNNHEEILIYFKRKVNDIVSKYSIYNSSPVYSNPYSKMSSYFGQFNANMVDLENELNNETTNVLQYLREDMDIACVINDLIVCKQNSRLHFIGLNNP